MSKYQNYSMRQLFEAIRNGRADVGGRAGMEIERRIEELKEQNAATEWRYDDPPELTGDDGKDYLVAVHAVRFGTRYVTLGVWVGDGWVDDVISNYHYDANYVVYAWAQLPAPPLFVI